MTQIQNVGMFHVILHDLVKAAVKDNSKIAQQLTASKQYHDNSLLLEQLTVLKKSHDTFSILLRQISDLTSTLAKRADECYGGSPVQSRL